MKPMKSIDNLLRQSKEILDETLTAANASVLLKLIGIELPEAMLKKTRIYSDTLPVGVNINPYSEEERLIHFVWDAFAKVPYSLLVDFSIPFRKILANKLFKECGWNFICESNVSFNYGHQIALGNNVFFNRGVFLDSKGGVIIGDYVCLAEDVRIFTHQHSEAVHHQRTYLPVTIKSYAKIYSCATILPGVTIGEQAIVATGAIVTKDVAPNSVVAGAPAKVIRERKSEGNVGDQLEHIWLCNGQFQDETD